MWSFNGKKYLEYSRNQVGAPTHLEKEGEFGDCYFLQGSGTSSWIAARYAEIQGWKDSDGLDIRRVLLGHVPCNGTHLGPCTDYRDVTFGQLFDWWLAPPAKQPPQMGYLCDLCSDMLWV